MAEHSVCCGSGGASRRGFLGALGGGAAAAALGPLARGQASGSRPNVLVILADDMGFSDAGCYGGEIETPNLDRLADGGIRFTQHFSTGRCWPSRACILTGYYAQQVRRDGLPGVRVGARPAWARLLPEMLSPLGYRCYHSGKWHVDGKPLQNGFHASYRVDDQDRFFSPKRHWEDDEPLPQPARDSGYYATRAIADHAIKCLRTHQSEYAGDPFYHYLAFTCPHFPLHALQTDIERYRERYLVGWDVIRRRRWERLREAGIVTCGLSELMPETVPHWNWSPARLRAAIGEGEAPFAVPWDSLTETQRRFQATKMAIHAAMIDRMDREIGRVLAQLRSMGALDNTVVFFASDNGASAEQIIRGDKHDRSAPPGSAGSYLCLGPGWSSAANSPFRLHKSWVHEGGISSPLIVHWPAAIGARGELRHDPGHFIDIPPTIVELAGGSWPRQWGEARVPPSPGRSLVPAFAGDGALQHEYLFWSHGGNKALRIGDWKAVAERGQDWELYDLRNDRCEMREVGAAFPERLADLTARWNQCIDEFYETATGRPRG